jgi:uncharacterized Rmd1/YagE family protein
MAWCSIVHADHNCHQWTPFKDRNAETSRLSSNDTKLHTLCSLIDRSDSSQLWRWCGQKTHFEQGLTDIAEPDSILRCNTFCFRSTYRLWHLYTLQGMSAHKIMKLIPSNFLSLPADGWKMPFLIPSWKTISLTSLVARQKKILLSPNQTRRYGCVC